MNSPFRLIELYSLHDDVNFGCSFNARGNVTSQTVYTDPVTPGGGKTTTSTYDTLGNLLQVTDPANRATSFDYSDSWYDSTCSVSGEKAYVKTATDALSHTTTIQYYTCTGQPRTVTDPNSQAVTYAYGSGSPQYGRLSSITDPLSNFTSYTYSGATQSESSLTFNSGASTVDVLSVLDSLARPRLSQRKQSPSSSSYDSTEIDYDVIGRVYKSTLPFSATAGGTSSTTPGVTYQYDALGRPTLSTDGGGGTVSYSYSNNDVYVTIGPTPSGESNSKRRQLEYDGLGRLKSVCEITSGTGSGTCSQTTSRTGYWTQYTYDVLDRMTVVTQNAQATAQPRNYYFDGLGRMTRETNPESGDTYYTYDTDATCGTQQLDLVKRTDAVGNVTCYAYDALHRVTDVTYPSGSYASVTPPKHFVYDSATVNGVTMSNAVGRMAEAYTGSSGSKITDLGFSYTARGETSDMYQKTPNSGGYYHLTSTYWAHGALKSLAGLSGLPTLYYGSSDGSGLDGEGRLTKVNASTGQNPITGVTYTTSGTSQPIGSLTQATFGSADYDSFNYDVNTFRLTQYQFTLNGSSVTGGLTWNANGSLGTLAITDALSSSNTQTCNYTHDDLGRSASVSCGSTWGQTFTFDPFGNISKSGSISFAGLYSTATNRLTNMSSSYDANGNLTGISADATYSYSWDAEGRSVSITRAGARVDLTYDALGRMVEQNRSGSYTQIVYGPGGNKLGLMSGSSLQKAFVPLPGGGQAVYTGTGLAYYRHADWLGSSRLASTPSRAMYYDGAYAPYGESYVETGTTDRDFTGQNQDTTTGVHDFLYREYHPVSGRWVSPDPAGAGAADPAIPQSWNRYAYGRNTPTALIDPKGLNVDAGWGGCPPSEMNCGGGTTWDADLLPGGFASGFYDMLYGNWMTPGALNQYLAAVAQAFADAKAAKQPNHLEAQSDCILANGARQITYALENDQGKSVDGYYVTEHIVDRATGKPNSTFTSGDNRNGPGTSSGGSDAYFTDRIVGLISFDVLQTFAVSTTAPGKGGASISVFVVDDYGKAYGTNGIFVDSDHQVFVNGTLSDKRCQ